MNSFKESLGYWSGILGTVLGVFGLGESSIWLSVVGVVLIFGSVAAILYAQRSNRKLKLASVVIEGRTIDSLNAATISRRLNRSLVVQEAEQVVTIEGEDLTFAWRYAGYCRAEQASLVEFSIDTDNNVPFDRLDCTAYDLRTDPHQAHAIRPVLLGADGLSKKLGVPFLRELSRDDSFSVLLRCRLPGCIKTGVDYYASSFSVAQSSIPSTSVRLLFVDSHPEWVRVYDCGSPGAPKLLSELRPIRETGRVTEYLDYFEGASAQSARVYLFRRATGFTVGERQVPIAA